MTKVRLIQKAWTLAQRMVPRPAQDREGRAPSDGRKAPEELSPGMTGHNGRTAAFKTSAFFPAEAVETSADARLLSQTHHEASGSPADMNVTVEVLAEQMLTLVEVVSVQEKEIKALKAHCQQLEEHDQAIMVAFTTFFHVLAAKRIARLEDIFAILQNISETAEREAYPEGSIRLLQRLATMLREQSGARAAE